MGSEVDGAGGLLWMVNDGARKWYADRAEHAILGERVSAPLIGRAQRLPEIPAPS